LLTINIAQGWRDAFLLRVIRSAAEYSSSTYKNVANNLEAAIPKILAQGLQGLRENSIMGALVNRNFDTDARQRGSTVDVPIPSAMGEATDVIPNHIPYPAADIKPALVQVKLDQWKKQEFVMTDKDILQVMDGFQNLQVLEAARSLANAVDKGLLMLYKQIPGIAGTAGQTPFQPEVAGSPAPYRGLGAAQEARKVLNRQLAPMSDRRIILDVDAEANATSLPQFISASDSGSVETIREGMIGRKLGFDWYMTQNSLVHVTQAAGTVVTTGTANTVGAKTLTVSGATVAPTEGDLFKIAGDPNGYVVGKDATLTSWPIFPALKVAAAASTAITVVASHVVNMAFHRDAFALAVRPLLDIDPIGNRIESFTDNLSGLTMRLEISREYKQTKFCFDVLYGCAVIRPEAACRILG